MKTKLPDLSFINGQTGRHVPVTDRGLQYGDGLFETILCLQGKLLLEKQHIERLLRDSARLQISVDSEVLKNELALLVDQIKNNDYSSGVVKIILTRHGEGRGYHFNQSSGCNRLLHFYSSISYPRENRDGVRLSLCNERLPDNSVLAGIKHLNRLEQVLLQKQVRRPFCQEGLVFGAHGEMVEGTFSNLFIINKETVITPRLDRSGVRGVMRDYILNTILPAVKLKSEERMLFLDEVLAADEVFICNSIFGIWPVQFINVKEFAIGKKTQLIQSVVDKLGYKKIHNA